MCDKFDIYNYSVDMVRSTCKFKLTVNYFNVQFKLTFLCTNETNYHFGIKATALLPMYF